MDGKPSNALNFNRLTHQMYHFFKPFLFRLSPEKAHHFTFFLLDLAHSIPPVRWFFQRIFQENDVRLERHFMGLKFKNPIGLAAGFDKNGAHIEALAMLGFGFIEVGTVTPIAQEGNPQPRLFRLPADRALINRMGFNNDGLEILADRLRKWHEKGRPGNVILGGNIGKNKATPNEKADDDYARCFEMLADWVDYFVVNVSSPNTPGLRELQEKEPLTRLLARLQSMNEVRKTPRPILLKIAPDLSETQLFDIVEIVKTTRLAGVIATNTTISRADLQTNSAHLSAIGQGGLSGLPLARQSSNVVHFLRKHLDNQAVVIGVGGIDSPVTAFEKLKAGADLLQVYTGLIYEGPGLVRRLCQNIAISGHANLG